MAKFLSVQPQAEPVVDAFQYNGNRNEFEGPKLTRCLGSGLKLTRLIDGYDTQSHDTVAVPGIDKNGKPRMIEVLKGDWVVVHFDFRVSVFTDAEFQELYKPAP